MFARPKTTPLHYDEVYWIGSTYYYHLAFERFDWTHADWKLQSAQENPPVAKYVLGLGLALTGQHLVNRDMLGCFHVMFQESRIMWGEGEEYAKRAAVVGDMTVAKCGRPHGPGVSRPRALPYLARYVIVACTALTSLLLFLFGASVANRATGLIASQLLLFHPDAIFAYNHAMSDPVAMLFSTAAAFATWHFFRRFAATDPPDRRTAWSLALVNGALLALACGAKMNSLIVVLLFGAAGLGAAVIAWRAGNRQRAIRTVAYVAASYVTALVLFVAINPAILLNLGEGLVAVVREPQLNTAVQARAMPALHLTTFTGKLFVATGVLGGPLLFVLVAILVLLACYKARRASVWFVTAWFAIAFLCVLFWIPFPWSRYVLPVIPSLALLVAHTLVFGAEQVARIRNAAVTAPL